MLTGVAKQDMTPVPAVDFPILAELEDLIAQGGNALDVRIVREVVTAGRRFPIYAVGLGNRSPAVPAAGFFGGFHGLERIGAEVVIAYLRNLVVRLHWDATLHRQLESMRLVFMPLVNPGGMWRGTRANPHGVDLMRNSPQESQEGVPFLVGGQRISARLPWYRGAAGREMEVENQAVCEVVGAELLARPFGLAIDCHSGFGVRDRIWFPYAHTALPMDHLAEMHALKEIYDQSYASHNYVFEPQSCQYRAHGDVWDFLYRRGTTEGGGNVFLPLTLEMGSWLWVKKNPRQLFNRHGMFNPLIEHRQQRVLRRHLSWLDFVGRAASGYRRWLPTGSERERHRRLAVERWYRGSKA